MSKRQMHFHAYYDVKVLDVKWILKSSTLSCDCIALNTDALTPECVIFFC